MRLFCSKFRHCPFALHNFRATFGAKTVHYGKSIRTKTNGKKAEKGGRKTPGLRNSYGSKDDCLHFIHMQVYVAHCAPIIKGCLYHWKVCAQILAVWTAFFPRDTDFKSCEGRKNNVWKKGRYVTLLRNHWCQRRIEGSRGGWSFSFEESTRRCISA